jgi:predicted naringenin-chalcone synthase
MAWAIGDHGFEMTLGARVPDILRSKVGAWVAAALAQHAFAIADVGAWAIHPGGPRVIESVLDSLGLPAAAGDESRAILRAHGNMSSATILFILDRLMRADAPRPWVGLAFGPGLVGEMVVVR